MFAVLQGQKGKLGEEGVFVAKDKGAVLAIAGSIYERRRSGLNKRNNPFSQLH